MGDMIDRLLIADTMDWFFNIYYFSTKVSKKEVENVINKVKDIFVGEWDLEDITRALKDKFPVLEVVMFDDIINNVIDINER